MLSRAHRRPAQVTDSYMREILNIFRPTAARSMRAAAFDGMNENRDLPIIQVQGGKPVVLYPPAMRQAELHLTTEK